MTTNTTVGSDGTDLVGEVRPDGPAVAALIAAGIGALVLAITVILVESSAKNESWAKALQWKDDVGPLSGKVGVSVAAFFISWAVLHAVLKNRAVKLSTGLLVTGILLGLAFLGTFPKFFQLFAP